MIVVIYMCLSVMKYKYLWKFTTLLGSPLVQVFNQQKYVRNLSATFGPEVYYDVR